MLRSAVHRLDDEEVAAAIAAHDRAEITRIEAKHQVDAARNAVRDALFAAGQPYRDRGRPLPYDDLHRLTT